jgi:predicted dehydrogenase
MNIAFAGFRHGHIFDLWNKAHKHPDLVTVAGAWEDDDIAREEARSRGVDFNFASYDDMLNDKNIDIIGIGDYFAKRGSLAIKALEAGKHIIVDKPLCTNLWELDEIAKLSNSNNLSVGCMYSMRYCANAPTLKRILAEGRIGEIRSIFFSGQHPLFYGTRPAWYYEKGKHGGTINDLGIHGVDFVNYIYGLRVKKVLAARTWNAYALNDPGFKDSTHFMLELSNGAGVIADVSYSAPATFGYSLPTYWQFNVWGSGGLLRFIENVPDIEAYYEGEKEVIHYKGEPQDADYITDIINEIYGTGHPVITTKSVFESAYDTLIIQKAAVDSN